MAIATVVIVLATYVVWLFCYDFTPLPDNGQLTMIDGKNVVYGANGFQLDLEPFDYIGQTQECVFVFGMRIVLLAIPR